MTSKLAFDQPHAVRFTEARQQFLNQWFPDLVELSSLRNALDVGCGVGYFSEYLAAMGLQVTAVDGRDDNVLEAQRRYPGVKFVVGNIEDPLTRQLGVFDLVFCVGLLYHLENPFAAIRNLEALTAKVLFIESMVVPDSIPMARLLTEDRGEDQALSYVALVPSESCLINMLYDAGFAHVFRTRGVPLHEDFHTTLTTVRSRTMLVASKVYLSNPQLEPTSQAFPGNPWIRPAGMWLKRVQYQCRKPWREKVRSAMKAIALLRAKPT
jgi:SAM-dependent methyltransferase